MKCQYCGMPLSPTNTNQICPRCHKSAASNGKEQVRMQSPFPPVAAQAQMPFPPQAYLWEQASNPVVSPTPPSTPTPAPLPLPPLAPGQMYQPLPLPTERQTTRRSIPAVSSSAQPGGFLGFVIAGLCVVAGGLLLVFVYFMGLSLPQSSSLSVTGVTPVATQTAMPSPTAFTPPPTAVSSPTQSAFPGQQYISDPQMASSVNTVTAQPLQATTTFKINQRIYVTFDIHPNGKSGAVCLAWFLNHRLVTQFAFPVSSDAGAGYSYAIYGGTGPSYVQISWASTTACSDQILAQQVSFTVTQ